MKKLLFFFCGLFIGNTLSAQVSDIVQQTWYLRNIQINGNFIYVPYGESIELNFGGSNPDYSFATNGVENNFTANSNFNTDQIFLSSVQVSSSICDGPNCNFEDLYFYEILTNQALDSKTFTYSYQALSTGRKRFGIMDSNGNRALFTDQPLEEIDEALFQTWYLHYMEADFGDIDFIATYVPPISPTITINTDLSFTGFGSCNDFMGTFNYSEDASNGTILIPNNWDATLRTCDYHNNFETYYFSQFENNAILYFNAGENPNTGEGYFAFEKMPGFVFHFSNYPVLSVPDLEKDSFAVYPNPANDKLFIKTTETNYSISISDINGRIIHLSKSLATNEIEISSLNSGMYFITLTYSEGDITKKFIKN